LRFFPNHFLYNDADVVDLQNRGFKNKNMVAMNNGLDQEKIEREIEKWSSEELDNFAALHKLKNRTIIISSGRLEPNKYEIFLEILPKLKEKFPEILWVVVGDGSQKKYLENRAKELDVTENIYFLGAIYEDEQLAPWMLQAKLFIHPTAVGLSIMHAFGYGLPIVTHSNAAEHGPEFVAFMEGKNGISYQDKDKSDLFDKLVFILNDKQKLKEMSQKAKEIVQNKYNTKIMTQRFIQIVDIANKH
jgi:glycosyltransferase involved in cell wall biosynthesis